MPLTDAVSKDLAASSMMQGAGSPKLLYTSFLLGLVREFFSLILTQGIDENQLERGFATLVSFLPDKDARGHVWDLYLQRRQDHSNVTNAAIVSCGDLVDYLSVCLDLTESSEGAFL